LVRVRVASDHTEACGVLERPTADLVECESVRFDERAQLRAPDAVGVATALDEQRHALRLEHSPTLGEAPFAVGHRIRSSSPSLSRDAAFDRRSDGNGTTSRCRGATKSPTGHIEPGRTMVSGQHRRRFEEAWMRDFIIGMNGPVAVGRGMSSSCCD
jgi:hypothetical protein